MSEYEYPFCAFDFEEPELIVKPPVGALPGGDTLLAVSKLNSGNEIVDGLSGCLILARIVIFGN